MNDLVDSKAHTEVIELAEISRSNHNGLAVLYGDNDGIYSEPIPITDEQYRRLRAFSDHYDTTVFFSLFSAFRLLLFRHNIQDNVCVRNATGQTLCYTTDIRLEPDGEASFTSFLADIQAEFLQAIKDVSSEGQCDFGRKTCPYVFTMRHASDSGPEYLPPHEGASLELSITVSETAVISAQLIYDHSKYRAAAVEQMAGHYIQLLTSILERPEQKLGALRILSDEEMQELVYHFNHTEQSYPENCSLVDLFERQAKLTPANIAIVSGSETLTYDELNSRANQLARHLVASGLKKEDNVALLTDRSFDMIIGMYAIMKAGAAYVPVPPDYPEDRREHMIRQSAVKFVLTNIDSFKGTSALATIDMRSVTYGKYGSDNLGTDIDSTQLAYTIYTSGSTGIPKGVMIEHRSAVNLVTWVNHTFNVNASDKVLLVTSMGFDLSVYDIFGLLAVGGSVVIAQKEDVQNLPKLAELMAHHQITFWDSVPSTLNYLVGKLESADKNYRQQSLRVVFMSGDWIPVNLPEKVTHFFPNAKVISLGGATEGTVWSNYYPVHKVDASWKSIPYGVPIGNNAFYILNDQLQPVPEGVTGELFIGGIGVARGYAGNEEQTNRSFLPDPFTSKWGGRMYRTGDLGRMLPQKVMEFVGRKDNQVKINGHRVELGEIESVLRQSGKIGNAVVLPTEDRKQLTAYVVPGMYYDRDTIIAGLRQKLPDYMVPGKWIELDALPLTGNGKIDAKALTRLGSGEQKSEFVAPRNEVEQAMSEVWQEVLGVDHVGIHDNFFDLGGQSLLAVELITETEKRIGKELPVNILYKYPTIAQLYKFITEAGESKKWRSLVPVKPGHKMPVYIVHGDGLSISNFHNLADYLDPDQPVFSLQPIGLNGSEAPLENISEIARHYISEIIEHNPEGPYALGGYSFGGYVAIEMKKQLDQMGKSVKMLAIFDTDAETATYKIDWKAALPRKIKRQVPKFLFIAKSMFTQPASTAKYQYTVLSKKINEICYTLGIKDKPELTGVNKTIRNIDETNLRAFKNYQLTPFNDKVYLFKAKTRMYFVDDFEYLGWTNYAQKGVAVYEVPGDHKTMFLPPNVSELGRLLQHALDNC